MISQAKFLRLVNELGLTPSLKSYADTLLFYKMGQLACDCSDGDILEIGVGGSTYPLFELSEYSKRTLILVDNNEDNLHAQQTDYFENAKVVRQHIDSQDLLLSPRLAYCHIDGNKKYDVTRSDVHFCLLSLSENGIICQDDYGNSKWPEVTSVIHDLVHEGYCKIVMIGDSSAWITKPEYYDYWMALLSEDLEIEFLHPFLGLDIDSRQTYYYRNMRDMKQYTYKEKVEVFETLLSYESDGYLQMPYTRQSQIGYWLEDNGLHFRKSMV